MLLLFKHLRLHHLFMIMQLSIPPTTVNNHNQALNALENNLYIFLFYFLHTHTSVYLKYTLSFHPKYLKFWISILHFHQSYACLLLLVFYYSWSIASEYQKLLYWIFLFLVHISMFYFYSKILVNPLVLRAYIFRKLLQKFSLIKSNMANCKKQSTQILCY